MKWLSVFCSLILPAHAGSHGQLVAPSIASAAGLNTRVFFDNFCSTSTIDLNDSGSGPNGQFLWNTHNKWPNNVQGSSAWANYTTTPAGSLSISNCALTIAGEPYVSGFGQSLNSAVFSSGGSGYKGYVFSGDLFINACLSFDPATARAADNAWPAVWSVSSGFLVGTAPSAQWPELDFMEAFPNGNGATNLLFTMHDWKVAGGQNNVNTNNSSGIAGTSASHCYATLWQKAANHGGTGTIKWYYDGALITTVTYSSGGPASPGASPANPNGTFSILDGSLINIILGAGGVSVAWPVTFTKVEVWCASAACMTTTP